MLHAAPPGSDEVDVLYRQNSDFWYLTGLSEPGAIAVFRAGRARRVNATSSSCSPRDFTRDK